MQIPVHLLKLKAESIQHSQTHYLSLHPSTSPLSTASGPTCGRNLAPHLWTFRCFSHVLKVLLLKKGLRIITTRKTNCSVGGGANTFRLTLNANSVLNKNVVFAKFRDVLTGSLTRKIVEVLTHTLLLKRSALTILSCHTATRKFTGSEVQKHAKTVQKERQLQTRHGSESRSKQTKIDTYSVDSASKPSFFRFVFVFGSVTYSNQNVERVRTWLIRAFGIHKAWVKLAIIPLNSTNIHIINAHANAFWWLRCGTHVIQLITLFYGISSATSNSVGWNWIKAFLLLVW